MCLQRCISASPVITDRMHMVSKNRLRRVSSVSRPMRSRTLISELSQGTPEVKIRLKWGLEVTISTLETLALRAGCPGSRYRVLVWL